jgi:peptidoglycan/xylan/chitin deacetylase (PgdA/CDA1 family)
MDDGYRDNFSEAFPVLQRFHFPATIFLVTATLETSGHLTWGDLASMHSLVSFQSHTVHHYDLTKLPSALLNAELADSKSKLEANLHTSITHLAYPSGAYNGIVMAAARDCGYQFAWKKGGGPVTPADDLLLLPRSRVRGNTDIAEFARIAWSGVYRQRIAHHELTQRFHA